MVKSYLRYDLSSSFGLIAASSCNVLYDSITGQALTGLQESIGVWNVNANALQYTLAYDTEVRPASPCRVLAQHPQSKHILASGHVDGSIRLWNTDTRQCTLTFTGHTAAVTCLIFSRDGSLLISGSADTDCIVWDLMSECGLYRFKGHRNAITAMCLLDNNTAGNNNKSSTPQPSHLITASKDGTLKVWNLAQQYCIQTLVAHRSAEVWCMTLNTQQTLLITGSNDQQLKVWRIGQQQSVATVATTDETSTSKKRKHTSLSAETSVDQVDSQHLLHYWGSLQRQSTKRTQQLQFNRAGNMLFIHAMDRLVETFYVRSQAEQLKKIKRRMKRAKDRAAAANATIADEDVSSPVKQEPVHDVDDERMQVEDAEDAADAEQQIEHSSQLQVSDVFQELLPLRCNLKVASLAFSSHHSAANSISTSNKQQSAHQQHASSEKILILLADSSLCVYTIDLASLLALQHNDANKDVQPFALASVVSQGGHHTPVRSLQLSTDAQLVLSTTTEEIKLWNRESGLCVRTLHCPSHALVACFVPGNRYCVAACKNGALELYELASGECVQIIAAHDKQSVLALVLNPNSKGVTSGASDKTIRQWEFEYVMTTVSDDDKLQGIIPRKVLNLVLTRTLKLTDEVLSLRYSPCGRYLAAALLDSTIKLFHSDSLKFHLSLYGHQLPVLSLDISSDSSLLISGSQDKNIKIWGLEFGDCHKSVFAHSDSVTCVRFTPDTHLFWSAGKDATIKQWDADTWDEVQCLDEYHQAEVWALDVSRDGEVVVTGGNDRLCRSWRRTQEQLFLEEERERKQEKLAQRQALQHTVGEIGQGVTGSGLQQQSGDTVSRVVDLASGSAAGTTAGRNDLSLKGGERIVDALDLYKSEIERAEQHAQAVARYEAAQRGETSQQQQTKLVPGQEEETGFIKLIHKLNNTGSSASQLKAPQPLAANPLLFNRTPLQHVLHTLAGIKAPDLDEALTLLPFDYACALLRCCTILVAARQRVELASSVILFIVQIHNLALLSSLVMRDDLVAARQHVRVALDELRTRLSCNTEALRYLSREMTQNKAMLTFGEPQAEDAET